MEKLRKAKKDTEAGLEMLLQKIAELEKECDDLFDENTEYRKKLGLEKEE